MPPNRKTNDTCMDYLSMKDYQSMNSKEEAYFIDIVKLTIEN